MIRGLGSTCPPGAFWSGSACIDCLPGMDDPECIAVTKESFWSKNKDVIMASVAASVVGFVATTYLGKLMRK